MVVTLPGTTYEENYFNLQNFWFKYGMPGARTQNYSVKSRVVNLKMCDCKVGKRELCRG